MKKKQSEPRFKDGDIVSINAPNLFIDEALVYGQPKWNGFVYMYEIKDEPAIRLGENYLKPKDL